MMEKVLAVTIITACIFVVFKTLMWVIKLLIKSLSPSRESKNHNANPILFSEKTSGSDAVQDTNLNKIEKNAEQIEAFKKAILFIFYVITFPFIMIWKMLKSIMGFIIYTISPHCPQYDGSNIDELGAQEIDRWLTSKKVTETLASGKTKQHYVNCTKVKIRYHMQCADCGHEYFIVQQREK